MPHSKFAHGPPLWLSFIIASLGVVALLREHPPIAPAVTAPRRAADGRGADGIHDGRRALPSAAVLSLAPQPGEGTARVPVEALLKFHGFPWLSLDAGEIDAAVASQLGLTQAEVSRINALIREALEEFRSQERQRAKLLADNAGNSFVLCSSGSLAPVIEAKFKEGTTGHTNNR